MASVNRKFNDKPTVHDWNKSDHGLAAGQWNPQQKALNDAVVPLMLDLADGTQRSIQRDSNPVLQDIGTLAAQYRRVFAKAIPTYELRDGELNGVAGEAGNVLKDAYAWVGA